MTDFAALFHLLLDRLEGQHGSDDELDAMRGMLPARQEDEATVQDGQPAAPEAPPAPAPHPDEPQGPALTGGLGLTQEEHLAANGPDSGAAMPHESAPEAQEQEEATPVADEAPMAPEAAPGPAVEDGGAVQAEDGSPVVVEHHAAEEA